MTKYDRLFEFIPFLETASADEIVRWGGGDRSSDGIITLPYPIYDERVVAFINTVYECDLLNRDYFQTIKSYGICTAKELDNAINDADSRVVIALLTYYVRQERFCDGLWGKAIEEKIFLRLIKRLFELS
ncbi:DUF6508 domain-containing protein [Cohnella algarum]|uniref:DUF6508 domain-containing protein n=1 Tax=Cohnella algarum TaxID=2044859 RepID=UPI0019676173|nr:DUF6508 domain-containing protein [Cohnella algarum]MBN2982344.1 hypothetical protein [Cohnella algarum]